LKQVVKTLIAFIPLDVSFLFTAAGMAASESVSEAQRYVHAVEKATKEVPAYLLEIADLDKQGKIVQDSVCSSFMRIVVARPGRCTTRYSIADGPQDPQHP
jgi:uncharacterized membrane-anchored protein